MRIVDQAHLWFQEGKSDKVYEVDLVEVATGQYVVNFRYGRRGTALRDGTKTALPVSLEQGRATFAELIAEKTARGYKLGGPPSAPIPTAGGPATTTARTEQILLEALQRGKRCKIPLHLVVRKVGERGLKQAEPHLLTLLAATANKGAHIDQDNALRHQLLAALVRCGSASAVPTLRSQLDDRNAPRHLHDLAQLALAVLGGAPERQRARANVPKELLPNSSSEVVSRVQAAELMLARSPQRARAAIFSSYLSVPASSKPAGTDRQTSTDSELDQFARRVVLAVVHVARTTGEELGLLRSLNTAAELRRDAELFAVLTRRFEQQSSGSRDPLNYFRRRAARTLRRFGSASSPDYVAFASELLLRYHDEDAEDVIHSKHGVWDAFARYHALNFVLYGNSTRYERAAHRGATWRCRSGYVPGDPAPLAREESYPTLWDAQPTVLWSLGVSDAAGVVIQFAARALRGQNDYLAQVADNDLALALANAQGPMRQLAFEVARLRRPNLVLARAALASDLAEACDWVLDWVRSTPGLLRQQAELLALLITAKASGARIEADRLTRDFAVTGAFGRELVLAAIAVLMGFCETAVDEERAANASRFLLDRAMPNLAELGLEVLRDLLAHPVAAVALFGAELAYRRSDRGVLDQELLDQVLFSRHAAVRSIGARIVASTPLEVMKNEPDLLVHLALSDNAELRSGTRSLLGAVAQLHPEVGATVASRLIDALLTRQPENVPAHVVSLLRAELHGCLPKRSAAHVSALIGALSPHARECGGLLLTQLGPDDFALDDIVRLANHEILSIRQGAWTLALGAKDRFSLALIALARLCDARWEDSRSFAFEFVRGFTPEQLVPDTVIAICDSIAPLVQRFGLSLLHEHWRDEHAERYLLRLSEHPSGSIQLLVTALLDRYARGNATLIERLLPCLTTVLAQVNRGGVAKQRVLEFLRSEATASPAVARVLAPLLERQSLTMAVSHQGPIIATLVRLHERYPDIPVPIVDHPIAVQERSRRGV